MAGKNGSVGRLFVSVDADSQPAINALKRVSAQAYKTTQALNRISSGGKGMDKIVAGNDKAKKSTEALGKAGKKTGDQLAGMGKQTKAVGKPIANLQAATYRLSQAFVNLRYGNPLGVFSGLTSAATSTGRAMGGIATKSKLVIGAMAGIGAAVAAVGIGLTVVGVKLASFGLKEAANLETLRIQYEGLLGSAAAGAAEVEYILNLGKESVVPTEGLLEANRLLLAYGVSATDTRQSLVKFFSDFGSATGLSAARLQDMAYALGQVEAQGKANQIDMRQLANAGLNLATVYEKIAEQQGISAAAAKELTTEGKLTAAILTPAIIALGDNYADAAEKARDSTKGILANLKDITKINAGIAFEDLLESLKPALKFAEEFADAFDFTPIAKSFENLVQTIQVSLGTLSTDAASTADTVTKSVAYVVNSIGVAIAAMISLGKGLYAVWQTVTLALSNVLQAFVVAFISAWAKVIEVASDVADAIGFLMPIEIKNGLASLQTTTDSWAKGTIDRFDEVREASEAAGRSVATNFGNLSVLGQLNPNNIFNAKKQNTTYNPGGGTVPPFKSKIPDDPPPGPGPASKAKEEVSKLEEAIKSVTSSYEKFRDMAAKPLGSASSIEKSLAFDATTFAGNASSIVSSYSKMKDAVTGYYDSLIEYSSGKAKKQLKRQRKEAVGAIKAQYQEIYDLAKANEELAARIIAENIEFEKAREASIEGFKKQISELDDAYKASTKSTTAFWDGQVDAANAALDAATSAYEAAKGKLDNLISERDTFLSGIRDSAFGFVNGLTAANEAIAKVTDLDGLGSFSSTSSEGIADFKAGLQTRLDAVKTWRADIENLVNRGLSRSLLDDLIQAGPEGSGALAGALASETDASIAEINAIQSELAATVGGLQSSVSGAFFDAGINQQAGFVAQQEAAMIVAQAFVNQQEQLRTQALESLQAQYDGRVKALEDMIKTTEDAESAHAEELEKSMKKNADAADVISKKIQGSVAKLSDKSEKNNLYKLGKEAIQGLIDGMEKKRPAAIRTAQSIANDISATIAAAFQINSPSKLMFSYGEFISEGLALGMEAGLPKINMAANSVASAAFPNGQVGSSGATEVKVFIGDTELKDMVNVQITDASGRDRDVAYAGRRDF
jgi:tape measure domain-containing protein